MKRPLNKRVQTTYLLLVLIATAAIGILWLAMQNAPPQNAVLITSETDAPAPHIAARTQTPGNAVTRTAISTPPPQSTAQAETTANRTVAVYVSGAVNKPGVYTLPLSARVSDAITAAGGLLPDADMEQINLAAHVEDEQHISVLKQGEATAVIVAQPATRPTAHPTAAATQKLAPSHSTPGASGKVNLNTATAATLEMLPGIGQVLAARIVADREKNGPFKTINDLMRVPGIKDALFAKLHDLIYVEQ